MGNMSSTKTSDTTGKVILSDGSVHEFTCPLEAVELMVEHSQQVVVEFNAAINQKRPIPLPADHKLDVEKPYVMLPVKRGKPLTLSSEEAHRVLLIAKSVLRSKSLLSSSPNFLPLFSRICTANDSFDGVGHKFLKHKKESADKRSAGVRCLTELLPEGLESTAQYLNRQCSGKGWKPSLDTIKEKKVETTVKHLKLRQNTLVHNTQDHIAPRAKSHDQDALKFSKSKLLLSEPNATNAYASSQIRGRVFDHIPFIAIAAITDAIVGIMDISEDNVTAISRTLSDRYLKLEY
ncbi:Cyclin dependent kinase C [Hibiscus syriacus]|uniref:Cyclin dependent kinase C n=1 Tax=Hibiscus syriacus TaxID=106335 RepID=A0A6A2XV71_HIBSY|nr:Cyclin dependent kinase C [Hibiscus syriacus]